MILADTSAWVEYERGTGSPVQQRMAGLVEARGEVAVTEPVLMEVLAGARTDAREAELRRLLLSVQWLPLDPVIDCVLAARIYRRCRARGIRPRGLLDCMIAAVAHRHGAVLLAQDADLSRVARVMGIDLDPASASG